MGPGQLLAGAGWMTVGLCMVTVHSREHLPIPSPASCLVPCATACPMCRDSSRGGLSALTGLICPRCQRCPGGLACCILRSSATLGAAVSLGVCTEAAGALPSSSAPQAEPLLPPVPPDTWPKYMPLSRGHIEAVQVGHKAAPEQITQDIVSKHWEVPGTLQSN